MPAKTILTFLFLTSLGVVVFVCLHALPHRPDSDAVAPKDEVLVATTVLPPGTLRAPRSSIPKPDRDLCLNGCRSYGTLGPQLADLSNTSACRSVTRRTIGTKKREFGSAGSRA